MFVVSPRLVPEVDGSSLRDPARSHAGCGTSPGVTRAIECPCHLHCSDGHHRHRGWTAIRLVSSLTFAGQAEELGWRWVHEDHQPVGTGRGLSSGVLSMMFVARSRSGFLICRAPPWRSRSSEDDSPSRGADRIERALPMAICSSPFLTPFVIGEDLFEKLGPIRLRAFLPDGILGRGTPTSLEVGIGTRETRPLLRREHLAVFDCANRCGRVSPIDPMGHL